MNPLYERFTNFCGGSHRLALLVGINLGVGLAICASWLVCRLTNLSFGGVYSLLALPASWKAFASHPWTAVTYMVAQFSPIHLLFNVLWLIWFGRMIIESGREKSLPLIYLTGGLSGAVWYLAATSSGAGGGAYLTGSSAAVMAIMAVGTLINPDRRVNIFLVGAVKVKWVAFVCVILTIFGAVGGTPAGQAAHLGGLVAGTLWIPATRLISSLNMKSRGIDPMTKGRKIDGRAAANLMRDNRMMHIRLDELLDKVRHSGYDSLSKREKEELDMISRRIR